MPDVKQILDALEELDLNSGVGLIGEGQLLEPAKRAIFIGLGGTGNHALMRLKRIIHQRYKKIDESFAFIGIDTDSSVPEVNKDYKLLSEGEKVKIADKVDEDFFDASKRNLMPEYMRMWLGETVRHAVKGNGAGAKRAVGRALLFNSAERIINMFTNTAMRLLRGDQNANIDVFILAGISGGTGSGSLLDTAYIFRGVAQKNSIKHNTHAFIFMPDVNTNEKIPTATRDFLKPNAYAALKEIDYWMNIEKRGDVFEQEYAPGFKVISNEPPFNYCWPMTATNAAGVAIVDALNQTATIAAETICAWIAYQEQGVQREGFIKSFMDNRQQMTDYYIQNLHDTRPDCAWPVSFEYTACGASVAKLPVSAINTYLACIIFAKFRELYEKSFDDRIGEHLSKFCDSKEVRLTPTHLETELTGAFRTKRAVMPDLAEWKYDDLFSAGRADQVYDHYMEKLAEETEGVKIAVIEGAINRLKIEFKKIFEDTDKGPYYLNSFLQNRDRGLIALMESYRRLMNNEKGDLIKREDLLLKDANDAYRNGQKSIMFHGTHVRLYSEALRALYTNRTRQRMCDLRVAIYEAIENELQKKVIASYEATYRVLQGLSEMFKKNLSTFDAAAMRESRADVTVYSWDIFSLPEIVDMVTDTLRSNGVDENQKTELVKDMLVDLYNLIETEMSRRSASDLREAVLLRERLDVSKFMADFISTKFNSLVNKTLKDYMAILASRQGMTLQDYLVQQFNRMERESSPLFQRLPSERQVMYYGTLPLSDTDIEDAWRTYATGNSNRQAFPSVSRDTLVFMTVACGIPLYAATQLEVSEEEYRKVSKIPATSSSIHLVSSTDMSRQKGKDNELYDWRNLPAIIPSDMRGMGPALTEDRALESSYKKEVEKLFAKRVLRIVSDSEVEYTLVNKPFKQIDDALWSGTLSMETPNNELMAYKEKISALYKYVRSDEPAPPDIENRFGIFFEINLHRFIASKHEGQTDPLHEIIVLYSRSLNIRRDARISEGFFDEIEARLAQIEKVVEQKGQMGRIGQQIAKGFRCGIFAQEGNKWLYRRADGEADTLARGGGVDRLPICKLHEMFSNRKDVKEDIARIDEAYIKAVDEGEFDKEGFDAFKAELKKELKLTAEDTNATNELEMQKYILAEINRFVTEIEG